MGVRMTGHDSRLGTVLWDARPRSRHGLAGPPAHRGESRRRDLVLRLAPGALTAWGIQRCSGCTLAELFNLIQAAGLLVDDAPTIRPMAPPRTWVSPTPEVDVFIPVYNEPVDVVEPTVMRRVPRWHGAQVTVTCSTTGGAPRSTAMAARHGVGYLRRGENTRRQGRQHQPRAAAARRRRSSPSSIATTYPSRALPREATLGSLRRGRAGRRSCRRRSTTRTCADNADRRPPRGRQQALFFGPIAHGQGGSRRDVLLRHERRVPPGCTRGRRWLPGGLADRGLRVVDAFARARLGVRVRAGGGRATGWVLRTWRPT